MSWIKRKLKIFWFSLIMPVFPPEIPEDDSEEIFETYYSNVDEKK
jgi:hypothetical protein